jgi:hypothetical protein
LCKIEISPENKEKVEKNGITKGGKHKKYSFDESGNYRNKHSEDENNETTSISQTLNKSTEKKRNLKREKMPLSV